MTRMLLQCEVHVRILAEDQVTKHAVRQHYGRRTSCQPCRQQHTMRVCSVLSMPLHLTAALALETGISAGSNSAALLGYTDG